MPSRFSYLAAAAVTLLILPAAAGAATVSGLAGRWTMSEGSGATIADSSGHGNDGVLSGNLGWTTGPFGGALRFNGQGARVTVGDSAWLEPHSAVTVAAWVRHAGSPGRFRYIAAKGAAHCTAGSYGLYSGAGGGLEFYIAGSGGSTYTTSPDAGPGVWDGRWHFVAGTFDVGGGRIRLYVDGAQVGSGTAHSAPLAYELPDSNVLEIGNYAGCQQRGFVGDVGDLTVWSRALSVQQITGLMDPRSGTGGGPSGGGNGSPSAGGNGSPSGSGDPGGSGNAGGGSRTSGSGSGGTSGARGPTSSRPGGSGAGAGDTRPGAGQTTPANPRLKLRRIVIRVTSSRRGPRWAKLTISYTDRQGARVTFRLARLQHGVRRGGRCVKPGGRATVRQRSCMRLVAVHTFRHADRRGRTTLRLTMRRRRLTPGRYRLVATPSKRGRSGRAVVRRFAVRRMRHR